MTIHTLFLEKDPGTKVVPSTHRFCSSFALSLLSRFRYGLQDAPISSTEKTIAPFTPDNLSIFAAQIVTSLPLPEVQLQRHGLRQISPSLRDENYRLLFGPFLRTEDAKLLQVWSIGFGSGVAGVSSESRGRGLGSIRCSRVS